MIGRCLVVLVFVGVVVVGQSLPPVQSDLQKKLVDFFGQKARVASQRATDGVLKVIDSAQFRDEIAELPFANESSKVILELFRETIRLTTVVHNIPSVSTNLTQLDFNISVVSAADYLYNYWDGVVLGVIPYTPYIPGILDSVETEVFGFPPFSRPLHPTLEEAQQRPIYTALNIWQFSPGAFPFGGVSLVFSRPYIRSMSIISPVDTGLWKYCCNTTNTQCPKGLVNCEAWDVSLGTLDDFDHMILPNCNYWRYSLGSVFLRLFAPEKYNVSYPSKQYAYWELELYGNVLFQKKGLHFIIATFTDSFGTPQGEVIQKFCLQLGIPLIWALGLNAPVNGTSPDHSYGLRAMFLDPTVGGIANITFSSSSKTFFRNVWSLVNETLSINGTPSPSIWADFWSLLYLELPPSSHFHFLKLYQCSNSDTCLGTNDNNHDCVCTQ